MIEFYAVPGWVVADKLDGLSHPEALKPTVPAAAEVVGRALTHVEYRGDNAWERAKQLTSGNIGSAPYASPPNDLPALLRTADQLLAFKQRDAGQRAQLYRCSCETQYAVPMSLMRPGSMTCAQCGASIDLDPSRVIGETRLTTPDVAELNAARQGLADFFREAMARGWPVLVTGE